ncbi:hypothetical protein PROFUN_05291 [Planoprotostelium fungivorum]|uniref:Uncharacterized protein n=1 Tax=Planoprotostelium fungivorum TaxID=1890364 RepID=A0A2P6NRC3_9EUKA|nr:hypothetical protein PROFUN_05291 [Planoprotostelium fungivorum]
MGSSTSVTQERKKRQEEERREERWEGTLREEKRKKGTSINKACGCETGELTVDGYEEDEAEELLNSIITPEYLKEGEVNYPIVARKGTNFASQFAKFWNQIISKNERLQ